MGSSQQFSLRWNNYLKHITCAFDTLRTDEDLVDVTLSCEGKRIRAHKMLLSACSTYFRDLFKENPCQHPVIIFRNVKFDDLAALVDFMYQGEVNVVQEQLASFLTTAELLAVQGLTDGTGKDNDSLVEDDIEIPNEPEVQLQNTSGKSSGDSKRNKSPSSPMPYHAIELQPEVPPNKRRKTRDSTNANMEKNSAGSNAKDPDGKTLESLTGPGSDPVEIIPLMPNLKLEVPEYLEQDGSSCSYEDQSIGDNTLNKITIDDTSSNTPDHEQKPDISQTFYSSQSTSDGLDGKHQSDVGHLLSKPSTSGERVTQEALQERAAGDAAAGGDDDDADAVSASGVAELVPDDDYGQSGAAADAGLLFRCRICWKGFRHPMSLTLHKDLHTGQTRCPICQRIFSRSYDMKAHLLRIHKRQHTFNSHTVVIEQPSHSCKLCGKSFWNRDSMYKHMNMHKGTTQCPVCHKVLSRTTHMKRHLKNRHGWHGGVGTTATATAAAGMASAGGVETPAPISVSSTAQAIAQQNAGSPSNIDANATYTTIRIRESSVERITSSPIP